MKMRRRVYRIIIESVHLFNMCLMRMQFDLFECDWDEAARRVIVAEYERLGCDSI